MCAFWVQPLAFASKFRVHTRAQVPESPLWGRRPSQQYSSPLYSADPEEGLGREPAAAPVTLQVDADIVVVIPTAGRYMKLAPSSAVSGYFTHTGSMSGFVLEHAGCVHPARVCRRLAGRAHASVSAAPHKLTSDCIIVCEFSVPVPEGCVA